MPPYKPKPERALVDPYRGGAPEPPSPGSRAFLRGVGCFAGLFCAAAGVLVSGYLLSNIGLMATGVSSGGGVFMAIATVPTILGLVIGVWIARTARNRSEEG